MAGLELGTAGACVSLVSKNDLPIKDMPYLALSLCDVARKDIIFRMIAEDAMSLRERSLGLHG